MDMPMHSIVVYATDPANPHARTRRACTSGLCFCEDANDKLVYVQAHKFRQQCVLW